MKLNLTKLIMEKKLVYRFDVFRTMVDGSLRKQDTLETTASSPEEALNFVKYKWAERFGTGKTVKARLDSIKSEYVFKRAYPPEPLFDQPVPEPESEYDTPRKRALSMFKR
jgi:hypothetical protein